MRLALACALLCACAAPTPEPAAPADVDPPPAPAPADPPAAFVDPSTATAALAAARSQLNGNVYIPPGGNVGVYLCAYRPPAPTVCAHGRGPDAVQATAEAGERVREELVSRRADPKAVRLELDLITRRTPSSLPGQLPMPEVGLVGFEALGGFVTPSELIERDLVTARTGQVDVHGLARALADRGGPPDMHLGDPVTRVETVTWLEGEDGAAPVRMLRTWPLRRPATDRQTLLRRARMAADHLARITDDRGRIRYHYDVAIDKERDQDNLLRHAGSIYALMQAYGRLHVPAWRAAGERAIGYLLRHTEVGTRTGPSGGGRARFVVSQRRTGKVLKLGGSALALIALVEHIAATGDERYLPEARELARFIVAAQKKSGELASYLPYRPGDEVPDRASIYYPGEAILGLVRLHEVDPNPLWLKTARRAANWLIDVRDGGKRVDQLVTDHWLMIAMSHLYAATRDARYLEHMKRMTARIALELGATADVAARYPDYAGSVSVPPRSTPSATRAEGLVGAVDACRLAHGSCEQRMKLLVSLLTHALSTQYTADALYWVPRRKATAGGVAGGLTDTSIRDDFVQHTLSATLGLARLRGEAPRDAPPGVTSGR